MDVVGGEGPSDWGGGDRDGNARSGGEGLCGGGVAQVCDSRESGGREERDDNENNKSRSSESSASNNNNLVGIESEFDEVITTLSTYLEFLSNGSSDTDRELTNQGKTFYDDPNFHSYLKLNLP